MMIEYMKLPFDWYGDDQITLMKEKQHLLLLIKLCFSDELCQMELDQNIAIGISSNPKYLS